MKLLLSDQVRRFLAGFVLMFALFQLSHGVAHAKIYSPVDIQPYDEQSARIIKDGFKTLYSHNLKDTQDRKNAAEAIKEYLANPTPLTKAHAAESHGKALKTSARHLKAMKEAVVRVEPEMRKYAAYLKKIIKSTQENEGYNRAPDMKKPYVRQLKSVEYLLSKLDELGEYLNTRLKNISDISVMYVQRGVFEKILGGSFPEPGNFFDDIGSIFEDLNKFEEISFKFLSNENTGFNLENSEKGWERVQNAMNDNTSGY